MLLTLRGPHREIAVNISEYWADQRGIGIKGWVSGGAAPPEDLEFLCDGAVAPITSWHSREDIAKKAAPGFRGKAWGFFLRFERTDVTKEQLKKREVVLPTFSC